MAIEAGQREADGDALVAVAKLILNSYKRISRQVGGERPGLIIAVDDGHRYRDVRVAGRRNGGKDRPSSRRMGAPHVRPASLLKAA